MDWITTSGSSIDEAKSNALDQLGIVADEAEFDIVNDVEKGLFGRVKTEAKVRARVRPKAPAAKDDRRRRGNGKNRDGGGGGGGRSRNRGGKRNGGGGDNARPQQSQQKKQAQQQPERKASAKRSEKATADQSEDGGRNSADSRTHGGRGGSGQGSQNRQDSSRGDRDRSKSAGRTETKKETVDHEFSRTEQEQAAVEFLEGLVDVLDMEATVEVSAAEAEDGAIEIDVHGVELGLLVGPKGSTLGSVQELTRTVVQRQAQGARTERLRVDVAGYRERRKQALQQFVRGIAEDVLESGSEKILEPMGPPDRKVVHDTVNEIDGVETGSEGEEPRRRVVIRPAG
jgi:spoIIIJ-associated protein